MWREVECKGDLPCPRAQHSATLVGDNLIVIGGFTGDALLNDVHVLNLTSGEWRRIETKGVPPAERHDISEAAFRVYPARHSATLLTHNKHNKTGFLVYVGASGIHLLNIANWTWEKPEIDNVAALPSSLVCHSAIEVSPYKMVILGGISDDQQNSTLFSLEFL